MAPLTVHGLSEGSGATGGPNRLTATATPPSTTAPRRNPMAMALGL